MMKSHLLPLVLGVLLVAGCSLDIPAVKEVPAVKEPYDTWSADGLTHSYYSGNDTLLWYEVYQKDTNGNAIRRDTYSAAKILQSYDLMRVEPYSNGSGGTVWRQTRLKRFLPPKGTAAPLALYGEAWGYDAQGDEVQYAKYNTGVTPPTVQTSHWYWYGTASGSKRVVQGTWYNADGTPSWHDLYQHRDSTRKHWWDATDHLWINGGLNYSQGGLMTQDFDATSHLVTAQYELNGKAAVWSRTTHDFIPSLNNWKYRETWSTASASPLPDLPVVGTLGPTAPVAPTTPYVEANHKSDLLNGLTLPAATHPSLLPLSWPASLHLPTTWTRTGGRYILPGRNYVADGGRVTIDMDAVEKPLSISWVQDKLPEIRTDFAYDLFGQLKSRVVQYGGNPVLTINLTRDDQGRITQVATAGSMMRLPLDYSLTYTNGLNRPDSLVVSTKLTATKVTDLMTLLFTYDTTKTAADLPFGLGALNFDETIDTITLGVGGLGGIKAVEFDFAAVAGTDKEVSVYDVLGKGGPDQPAKVLKGKLFWTVDGAQRPAGLQWRVSTNGTTVEPVAAWEYQAAWGNYAQIAGDAVAPAGQTLAEVRTKVQDLLGTVESFDVEKLFQLFNAVQSQFPDYQKQYERTASNLIDQVKAASGN